jgi:hypothetical protein
MKMEDDNLEATIEACLAANEALASLQSRHEACWPDATLEA